jgi:hypothetical protein
MPSLVAFSKNIKMTDQTRKILVHVCCAACTSHVFSELRKAGFEPIAFYYNPQIDDEESQKRKLDLEKYCQENKYKFIAPEPSPDEFHEMIGPFKDKKSLKYIAETDRYRRRRCVLCNSLLIQRTIEQAKRQKVKFFTTTTLCSPYKNHNEIIDIANDKALDYELNFYYQDFRKGFWMGRNYARNHQIYVSGFCGCDESKIEKRLE